jgi:hypothetical protein
MLLLLGTSKKRVKMESKKGHASNTHTGREIIIPLFVCNGCLTKMAPGEIS